MLRVSTSFTTASFKFLKKNLVYCSFYQKEVQLKILKINKDLSRRNIFSLPSIHLPFENKNYINLYPLSSGFVLYDCRSDNILNCFQTSNIRIITFKTNLSENQILQTKVIKLKLADQISVWKIKLQDNLLYIPKPNKTLYHLEVRKINKYSDKTQMVLLKTQESHFTEIGKRYFVCLGKRKRLRIANQLSRKYGVGSSEKLEQRNTLSHILYTGCKKGYFYFLLNSDLYIFRVSKDVLFLLSKVSKTNLDYFDPSYNLEITETNHFFFCMRFFNSIQHKVDFLRRSTVKYKEVKPSNYHSLLKIEMEKESRNYLSYHKINGSDCYLLKILDHHERYRVFSNTFTQKIFRFEKTYYITVDLKFIESDSSFGLNKRMKEFDEIRFPFRYMLLVCDQATDDIFYQYIGSLTELNFENIDQNQLEFSSSILKKTYSIYEQLGLMTENMSDFTLKNKEKNFDHDQFLVKFKVKKKNLKKLSTRTKIYYPHTKFSKGITLTNKTFLSTFWESQKRCSFTKTSIKWMYCSRLGSHK